MNKKVKSAAFPAAFSLLAAAIAAASAAIFVNPASEWFSSLELPAFLPDKTVQIVLWCVSLAAAGAGVAAVLIKGCGDRKLYLMFAGAGVGIILINALLYALHSITWAVVIIIALLVLSCYITLELKKRNCKAAFWLFAAFTVWIAFMTVAAMVLMLLN